MEGLKSIRDTALRTVGFKSPLWLRQQIEQARAIMEMDFSNFTSSWYQLAEYLSPRRPRFLASDVNKGWRRDFLIVDDTAGQCVDTLAAGMLAGLSSPTRQWFMVNVNDPELRDVQEIKDWCQDVTTRMDDVLYSTNLYEELPLMYEDAGVFATGVIEMSEDDKDVVYFKSAPIGSYKIQHDNHGRMSMYYREFMMTVDQLLDEFGVRDENGEITNWDNFSQAVRNAHDNKVNQYWYYVGHMIRPNHEYEPEAPGTKGMPFLDIYFERGQVNQTAPGVSTSSTGSEQWRFLRIRGRAKWPIMELIWKKTGEDDYGTSSPGWRCLGDVKQLQAQEKRISQAVEKSINPPMQGPPSLKGQRLSILPGDVTYVDQRSGSQEFKPSHEVRLDIDHAERRSEFIRSRIRRHWFYDLFMMMEQSEMSPEAGVQPITAAEVREKHEEKLLVLSPVLERANRSAFTPLIEFVFDVMAKRGMIPPPPPQAHGVAIQVQFTSVFAQALKLTELSNIERFAGWAAQQAQLFPESMDNVDADELIRMYADKVGLPAHIIRTEDAIQAIRKSRAQQQAQAQKQQQLTHQAETAKTLAQAPMGPNDQNALTALIENAQGVS